MVALVVDEISVVDHHVFALEDDSVALLLGAFDSLAGCSGVSLCFMSVFEAIRFIVVVWYLLFVQYLLCLTFEFFLNRVGQLALVSVEQPLYFGLD